jgi:hypothetical protein
VWSLTSFVSRTIHKAQKDESSRAWAGWLLARWTKAQRDAADPTVRRQLMLGQLVASRWTELEHVLGDGIRSLEGVLFDTKPIGEDNLLESLSKEVSVASADGGPSAPWRSVSSPKSDASLPAHEQGYRLANEARRFLGIPEEPLADDMSRMLEAFGVDARPFRASGLFWSAVVAGGEGQASVLYAEGDARFGGHAPRRFALAAALGRLLAEGSRPPFGAAHGAHSRVMPTQRANAFAAEFLLPRSALMRGGDIETLCDDYGISRSAAQWHRKNRLRPDSTPA